MSAAGLLSFLRRQAPPPPAADADLVRAYVAERYEAPFRQIVVRHGPGVLRLCRHRLGDIHAAEDAFQATFLLLARKAATLRCPERLAAWLYGTARRVCATARRAHARRRAAETRVAPRPPSDPAAELTARELLDALDDELDHLPEHYRLPLWLVYWQGHTHAEAACQLGLSAGALHGRLDRGRARLAERLRVRGLAPADLRALLLAAGATAVPRDLLARTAALAVAPWSKTIPATILALTAGPSKSLLAAALALSLLGAGMVGLVASRERERPEDPQPPVAHAPGSPQTAPRMDAHGDALPPGALVRMGTARLRHDHPPSQLTTAFSADGKLLASGGWEDLRIWSVGTGKLLREIRDGDQTRSYCALVLAPDGRWLAGAGRTSVCVWDVATGRRLHEFPADGHAIAHSPDGRLLAAASRDGSLTLWDTSTGRQTFQLRDGDRKGVHWPTFTADGRGLVSLLDNRVCHWDLAAGKLRKAVDLPRIPSGYGVAISPDGQALAIVPRNAPIVVWDLTTGNERFKLQGELANGGFGIAFSPDGQTLVTNGDNPYQDHDAATVALWDAKSGAFRRRLRLSTRYIQALQFSPDGRTLLTTGSEPLARLWDVNTGKEVLQWPAHTESVPALAFTPDGRSLVSGGLDGTVRLWEASSGRQVRELTGHRIRCDVVAVTPDGQTVLSGGADGFLNVQDLTGKLLHRSIVGRMVLALGVTPEGKTAATWSRSSEGTNQTYDLWDLSTGRASAHRPDTSSGGEPPHFSPDARLVVEPLTEEQADPPAAGRAGVVGGGAGGRGSARVGVVLSDFATGREVMRFRQPDFGSLLAFAPDVRTLVTVTRREEQTTDGVRYHSALHLWELVTGKERLTIPFEPSTHWLQRLAWAPDGRTLAAVRSDGTIQLLDLDTGKELLRRAAAAPPRSLVFAPDARSLATGHADGTILLWDLTGAKADRPFGNPDAGQLERWWTDLAGDDARAAYAAIRGLATAPGPAIHLCRDRLRPAAAEPADTVRPLIADLESEEFARREAATRRLKALGDGAEPALRAALNARPSAEQRRRIEGLLEALAAAPSAETLRHLRALELLELIGTPDARGVLTTLAAGVPESRLTRDAKASVERLARR